MQQQFLDFRSLPFDKHLEKLTWFEVKDGSFDRTTGIYMAKMDRAMYFGRRALVVLWSSNNPTFINVNTYIENLMHKRDKWFQEAAYTSATTSIPWFPLQAGVIRRKTKIAKLIKQLNSTEN